MFLIDEDTSREVEAHLRYYGLASLPFEISSDQGRTYSRASRNRDDLVAPGSVQFEGVTVYVGTPAVADKTLRIRSNRILLVRSN